MSTDGSGENIYGPPPVEAEPSISGTQAGPVLPETPRAQAGPIIDGAIEPPDKPLVDPEKPRRGADEIKTTPPKADEWLDFFSRIVLKIGMELYVDFAFRGIDDSIVSDIDVKRMQMKKDERDTIARPFAELATKTKFNTKSGRKVIALTDSAESLMTLGIWTRRVNRIAKKYRPQQTKPQRPQVRIRESGDNGDFGPDEGYAGSANGRVPGSISVINPGSG